MLQLRKQYLPSLRQTLIYIERQLTIVRIVEILVDIYVQYDFTCLNKLK